jgi:hypothetical protein
MQKRDSHLFTVGFSVKNTKTARVLLPNHLTYALRMFSLFLKYFRKSPVYSPLTIRNAAIIFDFGTQWNRSRFDR